jgi:hypothetical protein
MRWAITLLAVLAVLAAACGDDDTGSTEGTSPWSTAAAPASTEATEPPPPPPDLVALVLASEVAERLTPVPGESGEVTTDILPPDSAMRLMLEGYGVLDGFATVFANDDGSETIIVAAIAFASVAGASDALAALEDVRGDIDSAGGPVVVAATGDPLLGTCASIDMLEQDGSALVVWLNTSECHTWDKDSPVVDLACPAELAVGATAEVTVTVPTHYAPLTWQIDVDNFFWREGFQLELGEQTVTGETVTVSVTATGNAGSDADMKAVLFTFSDIEAFGGTYRVSGPRVEAVCTIPIVAGG